MTIRQLKEMLAVANLSDDSEVVVNSDSRSRDYLVDSCRCVLLESRYFGGPEPSSTELVCLVLDID
jgi:hypothetical protein